MSQQISSKQPDNALFIGLLILIFWLPLPLGSNRPWAWAIMIVWINGLFLGWLWQFFKGQVELTQAFYQAKWILILWCFWLIELSVQIIPLSPIIIETLSPNAVTSSTLTLSVDPHATTAGLLKSISYVLLFILVLLLVNQPKRLYWLAYTIVFSGLFQAVYGSLMTLSGLEYSFFQEKSHYLGVATGTFVNRNHLAGYLEMSLSIGIGLFMAQIGNTRYQSSQTWGQTLRTVIAWLLSEKMRLRLYLVVMVIALVLTRSRMGNFAFVMSLMLVSLLTLFQMTRTKMILLTSLLIIDLFIIGHWFGVEKIIHRLENTQFLTETRDEVHWDTFRYWQDYWWTGSGLGSFYSLFPHYRSADIKGFYNHAHNDYLEFGAETGIIGLTLLGNAVILSLWVGFWVQYHRRHPLYRGLAFGTTMGIMALLIHSTVDFNLQIPANAATFMILLALVWVQFKKIV